MAELSNSDWSDSLQLLLGEKVLPVLVLTDELLVGALNSRFLLLKLANFLLKHLHLVSLLQTASDGTLTILKSLARLFVLHGIIGVIIGAATIDNGLLHVLDLFLGQHGLRILEAGRVFALLRCQIVLSIVDIQMLR